MAKRPEQSFRVNEAGTVRTFRLVPWVTAEDYVDLIVMAQASVIFHGTSYVPDAMTRQAKDQLLRLRLVSG
jgi:hypothetical protein